MLINVWQRVLAEMWFLVYGPVVNPELWWILTPILFALFASTLYYGVYIKESMGYGSALSNGIVLFFVGLDLLRTLYHYSSPPSMLNLWFNFGRTFLVFFIMFEGYLLARAAFKHAVPENVMYVLASPVSVNTQAYVLAVLVYNYTVPSFYTVAAAILLMVVVFIALRLFQEFQHLILGHHSKLFATINKKILRIFK